MTETHCGCVNPQHDEGRYSDCVTETRDVSFRRRRDPICRVAHSRGGGGGVIYSWYQAQVEYLYLTLICTLVRRAVNSMRHVFRLLLDSHSPTISMALECALLLKLMSSASYDPLAFLTSRSLTVGSLPHTSWQRASS